MLHLKDGSIIFYSDGWQSAVDQATALDLQAVCLIIAPGKESRCGEEEGVFLDVTLVG